ncbi:MAG TPA: DoxX family protein, partial [Syntrophales bacterium]
MLDLNSFCSRWSPRILSVMRIVVALLFMQYGAKILFGFLAPPEAVTPPLLSLMGLAGVLEFFGGLLVVLGLFTRPAAFILSGQMAVAYFMVHAPNGFWPLQNKGDLAMLWSFVFLYLAVAGGGEWSLDRAW